MKYQIISSIIICMCSITSIANADEIQTKRDYYESGQIRIEVSLKNDKLHGQSKMWYESGQLKDVMFYMDDHLILWKTWRESGQARFEISYQNGKRHGIEKTWYENGQIKFIVSYKYGKENGYATSWYENGIFKARILYQDGVIILFKAWDESGKFLGETR